MLTSQLYDANGQQLGELGFEFSDIWSGIKSAIGSTVSAVKGVADVACDAAGAVGPGGANLIAGFNKDAGYITGQAVNYCNTYNQFTQPSASTTAFPPTTFPGFPPAAGGVPTTPVAPTVPAGTITAFSSKRGMWRVAIPRGAHLGMFGADAPPFTEVTPVSAPPTGATQVPEKALDEQTGQAGFFRLNNPWMWVTIGGGAVALGTGGYFLFRRKHV